MTFKLNAKNRELTGKKVASLRQAGKIPAVLYGHGVANKNLELNYTNFEKVFKDAGESTLIDLTIDEKELVKVLVADVQYEPIKHQFSHIDFQQIRMDEKITATVEVKFTGESKAVKEEGGVLLHNIREIEIRCLPANLIHEIEVDISSLNTFNDVIKIKDLDLSDGIEIVGHEPEDVIATIAPPRSEEELAALEEKPAVLEAEAVKEKPEEAEAGKVGAVETHALDDKKKSEKPDKK